MRERWQAISRIWENNKKSTSQLDLLMELDYMRKLSAQLEWQQSQKNWPIRIIYGSAGAPTAAIVPDNEALVENTLFWIACKDNKEAHYLIAIINSDTLFGIVRPLMTKGQYGARHLHKHLWELPIPAFDESDSLHRQISEAGSVTREGVDKVLENLRGERDKVTVTVARREIRKWLRSSREGREVEGLVGRLLG